LLALVCASLQARGAPQSSPEIKILSRHRPLPIVEGDPEGYNRVRSRKPLKLSVEGPGTLEIFIRQGFPSGTTPGRTHTELQVFQGKRRVERLSLKEAVGGRVRGAKLRLSQTKTLLVALSAGRQVLDLKVGGKNQLLLIRMSFRALPVSPNAPGAIAALPLIGLEDLGGGGPDSSAGATTGSLDIPLEGLGEAPTSADPLAIALEDLGGESSGGDKIAAMPLVGLEDLQSEGGTQGSEKAPSGSSKSEGALAARSSEAQGDEFAPWSSSAGSGFSAPALHPESEDQGRSSFGDRAKFAVLTLRGLGATMGVGAGLLGGGTDLLIRTPLLAGQLLAGLSIDYLPMRLRASVPLTQGAPLEFRASLVSAPILLTAAYELGKGRLHYRLDLGLGFAFTRVQSGLQSSAAFLPAAALAFGPLFDLGPGAVAASLRWNGSLGQLDSGVSGDTSALLPQGALGSVALTLGYALRL